MSKGSKRPNKYYMIAIFPPAALIIAILFAVNNKADELKTAKYKRLITLLDQKMNHGMTLDPVKRTFDIEFDNLGLVLSSGITIMKVRITVSKSHGFFVMSNEKIFSF